MVVHVHHARMQMHSCVGMSLTVWACSQYYSMYKGQYPVRVTPESGSPCQADRASNEPCDVLVLVPWAHDTTVARHSAGDELEAPENV